MARDGKGDRRVERAIGRHEPINPPVQTVSEYLAAWIFPANPPSAKLIDSLVAAGRLTR